MRTAMHINNTCMETVHRQIWRFSTGCYTLSL